MNHPNDTSLESAVAGVDPLPFDGRWPAALPQGAATENQSVASATPRPVIRGESFNSISIDWLSWTVKNQLVTDITAAIGSWVGLPVSFVPTRRGWMGFKHHATLVADNNGQFCGLGIIAWGGDSQNGAIHASMTGAGVAVVKSWEPVVQGFKDVNATLTRVDIAADDLAGRWSVDKAVRLYKRNGFSTGGRQPLSNTAGDWLRLHNTGRTLYIGKRENGKMMRVYEKGKQLGDMQSPWVRWELQINRKDRHIPVEVLTAPKSFLADSYGCMSDVAPAIGERIKIDRKVRMLKLKHLVKHCRSSYGKLLDVMLVKAGGDYGSVLEILRRRGTPPRLLLNDLPFSCDEVRDE